MLQSHNGRRINLLNAGYAKHGRGVGLLPKAEHIKLSGRCVSTEQPDGSVFLSLRRKSAVPMSQRIEAAAYDVAGVIESVCVPGSVYRCRPDWVGHISPQMREVRQAHWVFGR